MASRRLFPTGKSALLPAAPVTHFSKLIPEFATLEVTDQELLLRSTILELLILKVKVSPQSRAKTSFSAISTIKTASF